MGGVSRAGIQRPAAQCIAAVVRFTDHRIGIDVNGAAPVYKPARPLQTNSERGAGVERSPVLSECARALIPDRERAGIEGSAAYMVAAGGVGRRADFGPSGTCQSVGLKIGRAHV